MGTWEQRRHAAMLVTEAAAAEERQKHHPWKAGSTTMWGFRKMIELLRRILDDGRTPTCFSARSQPVNLLFKDPCCAKCASNNNLFPLLVSELLRNEEKSIFKLFNSTPLFRKCILKAPIWKSNFCDITKGRILLNLIWSLTPGAGYVLWDLTAWPPRDINVLSPTQLWGNNHADAFYRKLKSSIVAMAVNRGLNTPFTGDPFFRKIIYVSLPLWRSNRKSNMGTEKILCNNVSAAMLKVWI